MSLPDKAELAPRHITMVNIEAGAIQRRTPGSHWQPLVRRSAELISQTALCQDIAGVGGIGFDLAAQPPDVDFKIIHLASISLTPHMLEQRCMREDMPGIPH